MSKLMSKMCKAGLKAKAEMSRVLKSERGDTNIIAIIIILAIVIALAIVFKGQLSNLFNQIWNGLFNDAVSNFS